MKQTENQSRGNGNGSTIGLDIGTSRIVIAKREGHDYRFQTQLNAFVAVPYSKLTQTVLDKEGIPHLVQGPDIVVHGNESERFASLLQIETRRPMCKGFLNPGEREGPMMLRQILATLAGTGRPEKQRVYFSVPAAPPGAEENLTYHEATLRQILSDFGFEAKSINEGLAVVYSELEETNYTGVGISCGGGLCNVCLAYLSVPLMTFSIPKAGDFIDSSAASMTGELATHVRIAKEDSFYINGHFQDKIHQVLGVYYDEMIHTLVNGLREAFSNSRNLPKLSRAIPIVLSGGSTMPKGFCERFAEVVQNSNLPLPVGDIRMAANPLYSTAKGALVAALCED